MTNDVWSSLQTYANSLSIDSTLYTIDTNFDRVEIIFTIELIPPQKSLASANQQKPSAVLRTDYFYNYEQYSKSKIEIFNNPTCLLLYK